MRRRGWAVTRGCRRCLPMASRPIPRRLWPPLVGPIRCPDAIAGVAGQPPLFGYPKAWSTPRLSNIGTEDESNGSRSDLALARGRLAQVVADLGWTKANTSAIERFNLTDRMRNARKGRKTLRFSRRSDRHDALSWIGALRYNFHHTHRSLRQRSDAGRWQHRTPAMAAGIAEHRYSSLELMRLCPVGLG